jgi:hypothetical protein
MPLVDFLVGNKRFRPSLPPAAPVPMAPRCDRAEC